jgi:hypothetical protein
VSKDAMTTKTKWLIAAGAVAAVALLAVGAVVIGWFVLERVPAVDLACDFL